MINRTWTITLGMAMALAWMCGQEHHARIRGTNRDWAERSATADLSAGMTFSDGLR